MRNPGPWKIFFALSWALLAVCCGPAVKSGKEESNTIPHWDPSSNYGALSKLFSAALGTPLKVQATRATNILADGSNVMAAILLADKGPAEGASLGRLWLRPPEAGSVPVPALLQAWFVMTRPAVVTSADRIVLRIPGGPSREVVRVRYLPTPDVRDDASSDRRWWRFYAVNPGEPRMPLLLDGAWKKEVVPDGEHPETGLVESIQDWRTDNTPDWLVGIWLAPGSGEGRETMTFWPGAAFRYALADGTERFGWYLKASDQSWFLQTGRLTAKTPLEAEVLEPSRSRISYERGRACFATADGETPLPSGCLSAAP
ncbi:MAG: hypothetical protein J0L75_10260 [Spirochaetes bacterium]|nr:hypothetical protein [Spirochaetota bacterium]